MIEWLTKLLHSKYYDKDRMNAKVLTTSFYKEEIMNVESLGLT